MNQQQQQEVSQMRAQFCLYKDIDGSCSLKTFFMKKYKHLSKLKIAKRPTKVNPNQRVPISTKLTASIKGLKHLDLSQCNLTNYSLSQVQLIAKRFHKIIRFSQNEEKGCKNGVLLTTIMLKNAKNLRHLSLGAIFNHFPFHKIRLSKLKILDLTPIDRPKYDPAPLLCFSEYCPFTIEELSFSWKQFVRAGLQEEDLSLGHLKNLKKLALGMVLPANFFKKIAESIADPSKLKNLQFNVTRYSDEDCEPDIKAFLSQCCNLEELSLRTEMDIYPANPSMKLKKLHLEPTVEYAEEVLSLGNFIQQQKETLESLDLNLRIWGVEPKNGILEGLKVLKGLRKLKLRVSSNIPGLNLQSSLTELVEAFECLEEIDFHEVPGVFDESDFENFCKALGKRDLTSLKVCLKDLRINQKNSTLFIQTLMAFSRLEYLTLTDFGIEDPNFYNGLREMVCYGSRNLSRNLNELTLENVKREKTREYGENLLKMLRDMIHKPTMRKLGYLEARGHDFASGFKGLEGVLNLQNDVLKEVHHFNYLKIPSSACEPAYYDWDFGVYKWSIEN